MPYRNLEDKNKLEIYEARKKESLWHDNLKALLIRKAFLVYITLSELKFAKEEYGQCVKAIKKALNCYFCLYQISPEAKHFNVKVSVFLMNEAG